MELKEMGWEFVESCQGTVCSVKSGKVLGKRATIRLRRSSRSVQLVGPVPDGQLCTVRSDISKNMTQYRPLHFVSSKTSRGESAGLSEVRCQQTAGQGAEHLQRRANKIYMKQAGGQPLCSVCTLAPQQNRQLHQANE